MKKKGIQHHMDGLMALLVFGVFAVCVLAVLITGAGAYRRLTDRDQRAYDSRTLLQYVATRVRQGDRRGAVEVVPFGDGDCLALHGEGEGGYVTSIYLYDGYIRELYAQADLELGPDAGEEIMAAEGLSFALGEDGRLDVAVTANGESRALTLTLRTEGVAP